MNINFALTVFGWKLGTFDIKIDGDIPQGVAVQAVTQAADSAITRGVKKMTRWWTPRMAS